MKIVHFSDWHWGFDRLPEADLYVCCGDMYCNYLVRDKRSRDLRKYDGWDRVIDPKHEREMQLAAAQKFSSHEFTTDDPSVDHSDRGFRAYLGSPDAPMICVRGNHDFIDLAPLFGGCNLVHEFKMNETFEFMGLIFTGHQGIPWICGNWNDETPRPDLIDRVRSMPDADVYVTHYPPSGLELDGERGVYYGLEGMLSMMLYRERHATWHEGSPRTALHLFGHIHECGGRTVGAGDILFSQAATTYNVIEGSKADGWRDVSS